MKVHLIKRGKIIHCGLRLASEDKIISICSGVWTCDDKATTGDSEEVTCKRCLKILATADENGTVYLNTKRR